jgi:hypothetical protein
MTWFADFVSQHTKLPEQGGNFGIRTFNWVRSVLTLHASKTNQTVYHHVKSGVLVRTVQEFERELAAMGNMFFCYVGTSAIGHTLEYYGGESACKLFLADDGIVCASYNSTDKEYSIEIVTLSREKVETFVTFGKKSLIEKKPGVVYTITKSSHGYGLTQIGAASMPLVRENYSPEVLKAFDHIVSDLLSKTPTGRLSILDGPPGSGKTHLVRGILDAAKDCIFILIPPDFITDLSGPSLIPLMQETKEEQLNGENRSITIVIEDADNCIVPRDERNMSTISSLLNYTDGIFGTLFDLKVVATTNAKKVEIEPALLRAGRLSRQVTIGKLQPEIATSVYYRLTGDSNFGYTEAQILADIYAKAKGYDENRTSEAPRGMGFAT